MPQPATRSATRHDEAAEVAMRREALRAILGSLSPRERQVLELRYGLDGRQPRTLDEVARCYGITRERIRQIEARSLLKLRQPTRSKRLAESSRFRKITMSCPSA